LWVACFVELARLAKVVLLTRVPVEVYVTT